MSPVALPHYLIVSALVPYKAVDLAIDPCVQLRLQVLGRVGERPVRPKIDIILPAAVISATARFAGQIRVACLKLVATLWTPNECQKRV